MGQDTKCKVRGYLSHERLFQFIKENWDETAEMRIEKRIMNSLSNYKGEYIINQHSEDDNNWYNYIGSIDFNYKGEERSLFYLYENIHFKTDSINAETTYLNLGYYGKSVEIMKEILLHFGGGWLDENDCDSEDYYYIEGSEEDGYYSDVMYVFKKFLKEIGFHDTFGYNYYDNMNSCTIYTSNPGAWIGVKGENVKELKNMLSKAKGCDVEVKFIQIKGEILSL